MPGRLLRLALLGSKPTWILATALLLGLIAVLPGAGRSEAATADHLMCGWKAPHRTQTVSISPDLAGTGVTFDDVVAAFKPWNDLFIKYHGFPIFEPYFGNWQDADILVTARFYPNTWVHGKCFADYVQRGNNHSIVFLGTVDAWRNKDMLAHELGHTLGFADHGTEAQQIDGHIGFKPCGNYIGVMSYCTGPQSWFLDYDLTAQGILLDGQLVRDYWLP